MAKQNQEVNPLFNLSVYENLLLELNDKESVEKVIPFVSGEWRKS